MNENKTINIRLSTAILCLIIFALIVGMIFMYTYFKNKENTKESLATNTSENSIAQDKETNVAMPETKDLDTNSEQVKKLYDYIPVIDAMTYTPYNAYQTSKVTINNIDPSYILGCAFTKLKLTDKDKLPRKDEYGNTIEVDDGWFSFKADILQEKVKELYGQNVENMEFAYSGDAQGCTYSNGMYAHSSGGYVSQNLISIRKIEKAYTDGDDLIIEDKYIALKNDFEDGKQSNELFASSNNSTGIEKIDFDVMEKTHEEISDEIISTYGDKMTEYKHTFKKNADGTYYWYSTEPVK